MSACNGVAGISQVFKLTPIHLNCGFKRHRVEMLVELRHYFYRCTS